MVGGRRAFSCGKRVYFLYKRTASLEFYNKLLRKEVDRLANEAMYKYIMNCFEENENEIKTCT